MGSKWFNVRNKKQQKETTENVETPQEKQSSGPIRKAYNIYFDKDLNKYFQDTISYQDDEVVDFTREEVKEKISVLTNRVIRLFHEKIILKREDI